jgi:1-acyl-sn-glycerol-3-phosphate acyltransferase
LVDLRQRALDIGARDSSMLLYRSARFILRQGFWRYLRLRSENAEVLNLPGPMVLAPVHRSHLDSLMLASLSDRRIRALGKESLFTVPVLGYVCAAFGAIPVKRGAADRDAMKAAKGLLDAGESMIVFPEGGRQDGPQVHELFDGAAWLAARTGARVIPAGIAGTGAALPSGAKWIKRSTVAIVCGQPMDPPVGIDGKRANREQMSAFTAQLAEELQVLQDRAEALAAKPSG